MMASSTASGWMTGQRCPTRVRSGSLRGFLVRPQLYRLSAFRGPTGNGAGIRPADLVFDEIHVGAFTPGRTFEVIIPRLRDLAELGITAIELMPIGQFSGGAGVGI